MSLELWQKKRANNHLTASHSWAINFVYQKVIWWKSGENVGKNYLKTGSEEKSGEKK